MLERFLRWIQGRTGQYNDVNELAGFFRNVMPNYRRILIGQPLTAPGFRLIIPDHANHCDKHRDDWPCRDPNDQNEKHKLSEVVPACFCTQEFTA
jgi:hypothetical protein